jgi:hypothetical protein
MMAVAVLAALVVALALQQSAPLWLLAPLLPAALLGAVVVLRSRRVVPLVALALAVTPFPLAMPRTLPLGGRSLFLTDLVLPLVAVLALRAPQRSRGADRAVGLYGGLMLALAIWGTARGASLEALIQDGRGPAYIICGYLIASRLLDVGDRRAIVQTVGAVLWWSTGMIVASLLVGRELLAGRVGETSSFGGGDAKLGLEAVRFLIASKELALVAFVACLCALLAGTERRLGWRTGLGVMAPAAFVLFMGFSRQSVLGVAAGLAVIVVASPLRVRTLGRLVSVGVVAAVVAVVLAISGVGGRLSDPDQGIVGKQVQGFTERVVGGLFGENLVDDPGTRFRTMEGGAARAFAFDHPLVGGGLGSTYRGALELEAFVDIDYGQRYVHNIYLWYAVKGGLVGLLALLALVARPLVRGLWPAMFRPVPYRGDVLALGAAFVSLLVIGLVEPVMHLSTTAPLVGAMVGAFAVLGASRPSSVARVPLRA